MLKKRVRKKRKQTHVPLKLTYNGFCPNSSKVIQENWSLLAINKSLKEILNDELITAFQWNKNLNELIGSNKIENKKVKEVKYRNKTQANVVHVLQIWGHSVSSKYKKHYIYESKQSKKIYKIICASSYVIYLIKRILCI